MRYVYSVLRFVPSPVRGESVNLGVLVGSDESSEWELRRTDNLRRARTLDDPGILPQVVANVEALARTVDDFTSAIENDTDPPTEVSEGWLEALSSHSNNVLQFTSPAALLAETLPEAVEMAFEQFLLQAEAHGLERGVPRKHAALAAARRAFREHGLVRGEQYSERTEVVAGAHGREVFDFVVFNGRALQLVQAWSFQAVLQDDLSRRIRAWAWAVKGLRESGGSTTTGTRNLSVPSDIAISALCVPPAGPLVGSVWGEAQEAFKELQVTSVPLEQADVVGAEANRLLSPA